MQGSDTRPPSLMFLGKQGVGKSALFALWKGHPFDNLAPTIGIEQQGMVLFKQKIRLMSLSGPPRFNFLYNAYCCNEKVSLYCLVFSHGDLSTLEQLSSIIARVRKTDKEAKFVVLGVSAKHGEKEKVSVSQRDRALKALGLEQHFYAINYSHPKPFSQFEDYLYNALELKARFDDAVKRDAATLLCATEKLKEYVGFYSRHTFFNWQEYTRTHCSEVNALIERIDDKSHAFAIETMDELHTALEQVAIKNATGSFSRCVTEIKAMV